MSDSGNYVSEWFGHRVYPVVRETSRSLNDQQTQRCPFLSDATAETKSCIKKKASLGICSVSSVSNGPRQDWLTCPYRALNSELLDSVTRRLYRVSADTPVVVVPAPTLARTIDRQRVIDALGREEVAVVYLQNHQGGEISIAETERSPELSFDVTLVQILKRDDGTYTLGDYGIFEVQTMDFHGSYKVALQNLTEGLRMHKDRFHAQIAANHHWLSEGVEGPNIANVFKRTFYQIVLKFQIAADESCTGAALALPAAVWDSWQKHLGKPYLKPTSSGTFSLLGPGATTTRTPTWIYVFDLDADSETSPSPLQITKVIATDADSLLHHAFKVVPEAAAAGDGDPNRIVRSIGVRMAKWWPELGPPKPPRKPRTPRTVRAAGAP